MGTDIDTKLDEILNAINNMHSLINIGTFEKTGSVNISTYYPDYKNLTLDNIIVVINSYQFRTDVNQGLQTTNFKKSYDQETGVVKIKGSNIHGDVTSVTIYIYK